MVEGGDTVRFIKPYRIHFTNALDLGKVLWNGRYYRRSVGKRRLLKKKTHPSWFFSCADSINVEISSRVALKITFYIIIHNMLFVLLINCLDGKQWVYICTLSLGELCTYACALNQHVSAKKGFPCIIFTLWICTQCRTMLHKKTVFFSQ